MSDAQFCMQDIFPLNENKRDFIPYRYLRDKLFDSRKAREKTVFIQTTLCKLPLKMGSKDSLDLHSKLHYLDDQTGDI
jgi:hypothetical protein